MYGDQRHIFVMQSELENEIDFDDIKHTVDKYSKSFNDQHKQRPRSRQGRAKKATATTKRNAERKNYRSGDASEPHFRPAQRPAATNTKQRTKPPKTNELSEKSALLDNLIQSNVDALDVKVTTTTTTRLTSIVPSSTSSAASEASATEASETVVDDATDESDRKASVDKAVLDLFGNISSALSAAPTTTLRTTTTAAAANASTTLAAVSNETLVVIDGNNVDDGYDDDDDDETTEGTAAEQPTKDATVTTTTEAQLYQDHAIVPTMNRRGV
jgi:hypothetical protein